MDCHASGALHRLLDTCTYPIRTGMSSLYMTLGSVRIALPIRHILAHEEFASVVSRRARVRCTDSGIFSPHPCFEVCWCVFLDTHPDTLGLLGWLLLDWLIESIFIAMCVALHIFSATMFQPGLDH